MRLRFAPSLLLFLLLAGCGSSSSPGATSSSSSQSGGGTNSIGGENHVHSILVASSQPTTVYLGEHYRLVRSSDGGKTWSTMLKAMALSMAPDSSAPGTLYAVTLQKGLLKSTDNGAHWKPAGAGLPKGKISGVGVITKPQHAILAWGLGIYRSTDGGAHWTRVMPRHSVSSAATGTNGSAYAASIDGLYVSHDAGMTWKQVGALSNQPVVQVVASGNVAYVAAALGVFKTADGGKTWHQLGKAPQGVEFLGVSPSNPQEVFGQTAGKGFVVSHDGGATWHSANAGIKDHNFTSSTIQVAPTAPNVVYTGSWGVHFYASHDAGAHWTIVSTLKH